jgi:hypothetical protein
MPVPMVANFRGAGTGRWEGAQVFLQILTDQSIPDLIMWGRLCPPTLVIALHIFRPSDIPVNFIFLSRFTILSTYHYLFFFFFFHFSFFFKFCPEIIKKRRFARMKNEQEKSS